MRVNAKFVARIIVFGAVALTVASLAPMTHAEVMPTPTVSPSAMSTSSFTVRCPFSHTASVDPIVMPGMAGMSHQHEFFGNTSTNENSTTSSLLAATTTCARVSHFTDGNNHSAYWVPSLYQDGVRLVPTAVYASYGQLSGGSPSVRPFPNGMKSVTGRSSEIVQWGCTSIDTQSFTTIAIDDVPGCRAPQHLFARFTFAGCWNGTSVDSSDHMSHLVGRIKVNGKMQCPTTHPVRVPTLTLNIQYPVANITNAGVSLASGPPSTMHADMFEAWTNDGLAKRILSS